METKQRVLHRDIKSSNILLDEEWNAKVSDFGLSKVGPANQPRTYLVSNVVGTLGYCDPSYFETGLLSKESDVYSFGVVLFEVMCGRLCCEYRDGEMLRILVPMWRNCFEENRLDDIVFHDLKEQIQHDSLMTFSTIANRCLQRDHKKRPTMVEIVEELEIAIEQQAGISTKEESDEKLLQTLSESTTRRFQEPPPFLIMEAGFEKNRWWAFNQGFTYGRRLPDIPCDDVYFANGLKQLVCSGTHLLVSGKDGTSIVLWRYELETNKWYKSLSMITPRVLFASATCGNFAFVAGGIEKNGTYLIDNMVEKYDAETRSWSPLPRMKKPRKLCSGCYMDDKFYVIGGTNDDEGPLTCGEFFDQQTNQWTFINGMLKDINHDYGNELPPFIAVLNNELYLIDVTSNELKIYIKNTNSWKALGSLPLWVDEIKGWGVAFVSFCNELVVIGLSGNSMAIYTCSPVEPKSHNLTGWKLRDYGNIDEIKTFIHNCSVMQ